MKKEELFEVLGELDGDLVESADGRRRRLRVRWGAAACVCLALLGAAALLFPHAPGGAAVPGDGVDGGIGESGGGPIPMYSVAVYPPSRSEEEVETAEAVSLTEDEALADPLAEHLPGRLPEGFRYGRGSLYRTVMEDGAEYHMLRVEYITGAIPEQRFSEDGGAIAPDPGEMGEVLLVCVLDHAPDTDIPVCASPEEVTLALLEERGAVYLRCGECYIGVFDDGAGREAVLEVLPWIQ